MSDKNWEPEGLKEDLENLTRYSIEQKAAKYKGLKPEMRLEVIESGTLSRIVHHFRKGSFAVLPGYHMNQGKKKNFENEYKLTCGCGVKSKHLTLGL